MLQTTRNSFSQAVDASVRALFDVSVFDQSQYLYGQELCTAYEPDVPNEQLSSLSGPGKGTLTIEGQLYGANEHYKGYPVTVTLKKYTSELVWTEEGMHWLRKASSSKRAMEVTNAVTGAINALNQNINDELAKVFYLGFGVTNLTGGDAVALFSGSHPIRKTGSTQSNMFPSGDTHRAWSPANLVDAINIMNRFKGMNDIEMLPCKNIRVVCSKELYPTVVKDLSSMYGPNTANLGLNIGSKDQFGARGVTVEAIMLPDIPYAYRNYWFVVDMNRAQKMLFRADGWMPRMADDTEKNKGVFKNEASTYFGFVFNSWQWAFGSKGDTSAI